MKLRKNKFRLLLFAFTIASSIGIQAQQTLISVKLDTADILIGEQTTLNLTITTDLSDSDRCLNARSGSFIHIAGRFDCFG